MLLKMIFSLMSKDGEKMKIYWLEESQGTSELLLSVPWLSLVNTDNLKFVF